MRNAIKFCLPLVLLASGCHSHKHEVPAVQKSSENENQQKKHMDPLRPMTKEEIKSFSDNIAKAMSEIPPTLRVDFQKYLACDLKTNKGLLDADRIRKLTANLEKDRNIANCH